MSGMVTFEVPAGTYRIVVSKPGYQDITRDVNVSSDQVVEIYLGAAISVPPSPQPPVPLPMFSLEVRVVDNRGRPISGASVRVVKADERREVERAVTGADGRASFMLSQGLYIVEASKFGYRGPVERFVNLNNNISEQIVLSGYRLTIMVRDARTGQPVSAASVRVYDSTGREVDSGITT